MQSEVRTKHFLKPTHSLGGKKLLTPQPRLRTGFFSIMEASTVPNIQEACTSAGVAKHGKPVGLDDELKVDLLVIGSVAVDPATGARLGKGEVPTENQTSMHTTFT